MFRAAYDLSPKVITPSQVAILGLRAAVPYLTTSNLNTLSHLVRDQFLSGAYDQEHEGVRYIHLDQVAGIQLELQLVEHFDWLILDEYRALRGTESYWNLIMMLDQWHQQHSNLSPYSLEQIYAYLQGAGELPSGQHQLAAHVWEGEVIVNHSDFPGFRDWMAVSGLKFRHPIYSRGLSESTQAAPERS